MIDKFQCDDIHPFINLVVQILPYSGYSESKFCMCEVEGVRFLTKICLYLKPSSYIPPEKAPKKVMPQADTEIAILRLFRDTIINENITPCVLELIADKVCAGVERLAESEPVCRKLLTKEGLSSDISLEIMHIFCAYNDLVRNGLAYDKCAFIILEKYDLSFYRFLLRGVNTAIDFAIFKSLMFQIVYTFYAICQIYPGFRHYDLHGENVMLKYDQKYRFQSGHPQYLVFNVAGNVYSIPYFGIYAKIIDFGFSVIPEAGIVSDITLDRKMMYFKVDNDLLRFFHVIYTTLISERGDSTGRVQQLLRMLDPEQTYTHFYIEEIRRLISQGKILSYKEMLTCGAFDEYKRKVPREYIKAKYKKV